MGKGLIIREPTDEDIVALAADLRPADLDEITASHGPDVLATLRAARDQSTHLVAIDNADGDLLCIFGAVPLDMLGGVGSPWMLGTSRLGRFGRSLGLVARRYFSEVARVYPVLVNYVDVRNAASIRLLEWLGCSFGPPEPYGKARLPFMRFERRSD